MRRGEGLYQIRPDQIRTPKSYTHISDATDRQAVEAQHQLTNRASVKTASQRLTAKQSPDQAAAPGALTAALKKLHPQQNDEIPNPPPNPDQQHIHPNAQRILIQSHAAAATAGALCTPQGGGDVPHHHTQRRRTQFDTPEPVLKTTADLGDLVLY